jgi:hypothetical protein
MKKILGLGGYGIFGWLISRSSVTEDVGNVTAQQADAGRR